MSSHDEDNLDELVAQKLAEEEKLRTAELDRAVVTRWGGNAIVLSEGFLPVPRNFLLYAGELGLTASETLFVLALMTFKWGEEPPFPGYKRLAEMLGTSPQQARKLAKQLEDKGLLRRIPRRDQSDRGQSSNAFDLK